MRGGRNGGYPNRVAIRVLIVRQQIQHSGGILVEFLRIVDRYRRVVLRENVQRKARCIVVAFGIRRGHANGNVTAAVRNRSERQRIFPAAKARYRNVACVNHELTRIAGGNGDGKRIPNVLIRNGEPDAADCLVFHHVLAVDWRKHRIVGHTCYVQRDRRGGLFRAVRNGIGKRRVVVLANRGRIGKLLRRVVKRQRTQQSGCGMARNMQRVAVHVVVVVQHAEGMRAGIEHVYFVVLASRRILRRIDGQ